MQYDNDTHTQSSEKNVIECGVQFSSEMMGYNWTMNRRTERAHKQVFRIECNGERDSESKRMAVRLYSMFSLALNGSNWMLSPTHKHTHTLYTIPFVQFAPF